MAMFQILSWKEKKETLPRPGLTQRDFSDVYLLLHFFKDDKK